MNQGYQIGIHISGHYILGCDRSKTYKFATGCQDYPYVLNITKEKHPLKLFYCNDHSFLELNVSNGRVRICSYLIVAFIPKGNEATKIVDITEVIKRKSIHNGPISSYTSKFEVRRNWKPDEATALYYDGQKQDLSNMESYLIDFAGYCNGPFPSSVSQEDYNVNYDFNYVSEIVDCLQSMSLDDIINSIKIHPYDDDGIRLRRDTDEPPSVGYDVDTSIQIIRPYIKHLFKKRICLACGLKTRNYTDEKIRKLGMEYAQDTLLKDFSKDNVISFLLNIAHQESMSSYVSARYNVNEVSRLFGNSLNVLNHLWNYNYIKHIYLKTFYSDFVDDRINNYLDNLNNKLDRLVQIQSEIGTL